MVKRSVGEWSQPKVLSQAAQRIFSAPLPRGPMVQQSPNGSTPQMQRCEPPIASLALSSDAQTRFHARGSTPERLCKPGVNAETSTARDDTPLRTRPLRPAHASWLARRPSDGPGRLWDTANILMCSTRRTTAAAVGLTKTRKDYGTLTLVVS